MGFVVPRTSKLMTSKPGEFCEDASKLRATLQSAVWLSLRKKHKGENEENRL